VLNSIIANSPSIEERRKAKAEFKSLLPQFMELGKVSPTIQIYTHLKLRVNRLVEVTINTGEPQKKSRKYGFSIVFGFSFLQCLTTKKFT